jgi:GNAT superfamily N-acetyltransferase
MRPGEEDAVATMVRALPRDLGFDTVPKITGASLRQNADVVRVTVAEDSGLLLGACTWQIIYSSWRGVKGVYICDLYIMPHKRGGGAGVKLLRAACREANKLGAQFIKLEASRSNPRPATFYQRLAFHESEDDRLMFLEPDDFTTFIKGSST